MSALKEVTNGSRKKTFEITCSLRDFMVYFPSKKKTKPGGRWYKGLETGSECAEAALVWSLERNRRGKMMEQINIAISRENRAALV
ncbi:MAG: hypothetical protein JSW12_13385 [Deltaproteobacteria bacterium]|nr:MAG: hypothetical protein JSW12_13385 [Deltaproteobacteria bacterium]